MIRFTRSLLLLPKEYTSIQSFYTRGFTRKYSRENAEAQAAPQENQSETKERNGKSPPVQPKSNNLIIGNSPVFEVQNEMVRPPQSVLSHDFPAGTDLSKVVYSNDAVKISDSITPSKTIELLKYMVSIKSRPVKLLKIFSEKLKQNQNPFNLKELSDLFYCLAAFSYKDEVLLQCLAENVLLNKDKVRSSAIPASILQSIGMLKYRNTDLINLLLKEVLEQQSPKRTKQLVNSLMTLAVLNYLPPYGVVIVNELLKCSMTDFSDTKSYFDFVWACVLLGQYSTEHIADVLSHKFIEQLMVANAASTSFAPVNMKLLNINAAAKHLLKNYNGPFLNNVRSKPGPKRTTFRSSVIDSLSHIFPRNGYLLVNIETESGYMLDIECYMHKNGNPVPIKKKKEGTKIGIMLLNYKNYCLGSGHVETGMTAFQEQILAASGYKVVKVKFSDYDQFVKLHEKVNHLRKLLESACKG